MKVAIIIGHDKTSPGAYSPYLGMSEYLYNSEVATYLSEFCIYRRPIGGGYSTQMRILAEQINKEDFDLVVELHFNSASVDANGCECVIYKGNSYTRALGEKFNELICKKYGTRNRGIKEVGFENDRGYWFLRNMKAPAIILEPFFANNEEALKFENPGVYAEVIKRWLK